jgi:hypothetical protein
MKRVSVGELPKSGPIVNRLCSTLLFLLINTLLCMVCKLLQIRGHRFDSGMHLH